MTIGSERLRAVNQTRDFLRDLMNPKQTPRVPLSVRKWARMLLKHYPSSHEMKLTVDRFPDMWRDPWVKGEDE